MIRDLCFVVDVGELARWIAAIPFSAWPQQSPGVPAMVNDLTWHGFGERTEFALQDVMSLLFRGARADNRMLSVVMPGREIPRHADPTPAGWITRIHVPIAGAGILDLGGVEHQLRVGCAYSVDVTKPHAVYNRGTVPRIHLMWDVLAG